MNAPDRIEQLLKRSDLTGIDYIFVHPDQKTLDIYFLWNPEFHEPKLNPAPPLPVKNLLVIEDTYIYSPSGAAVDIPVISLNWKVVDNKDVLQLETKFPGDFSLYKFKLNHPVLDPFYNDVTFDFKANCPSDLDCKPLEHECPPEEIVDVPIDYLARDFGSFRSALLEMASLRYPDWPDRLEADAGIMMVELMSALGDEMAYYQDRIGREAHLETATQRRSLRRHARLIDYHLHDGLGSTAWIDIVAKSGSNNLLAGTPIWSTSENGMRIDFEIGKGIEEKFLRKPYSINELRNEFLPHCWDEDQLCLLVGTTEIYIQGHVKGLLTFDDQIEGLPEQIPGKWVLLQTFPTNPSQLARALMVRLIQVTETIDPVLNADITHLVWEKEQALPFEMDLTILKVKGNMLPATSGKTYDTYFVIGADREDFSLGGWEDLRKANGLREPQRAVEREGRDRSVTYLFSLPGSEQEPVVWLGQNRTAPEIVLEELHYDDAEWKSISKEWEWRRALIGVNSSQSQDAHFTLEDGTWRRVVGYQRNGQEIVHHDYASNAGVTIRFGDGEFGNIPAEKTVFRVSYRLGGTRRSNVTADTLTEFDASLSVVEKVTNPLPAFGGLDAETPNELRQLASDAFRAITYRAVRPEDYAEASERLPWVQRAGASFRWTGSWQSAFVTPDPLDTVTLEENRRIELVEQLGRFRQAGREAHVMDPVYANLDIEIDICAKSNAYPGEVKARVMEVLLGKMGAHPMPGYFNPDQFTFGTPLDRSRLEAEIQSVPGVRAVENIRIRRRGWFNWRVFTEFSYDPGMNAIIRVENDPLHPERGSLKLYINGGA